MSLHVGIDFGTSNSGVAVYDGSRVHMLPVDPKSHMPQVIKTILYITRDFKHYIGQEAVELYYKQNVNRLRRYVKKWVGEVDYHGGDMYYVRDVYVYVDELNPGRLMQFIKTALRSDGYQGTQVFERYYSLVDIISVYLRELKGRAEALLHEPIIGVTIGRPVQFSAQPDQDRRAEETLLQAAYAAGFQKVAFELEPVAAALYYETSLDKPQNVLIFDFGGGTLDMTILRLGDPLDRRIFSTSGIGVAGSDFDRAIIKKRLLTHFGIGQPDLDLEIVDLIQAVADWVSLPERSTPQVQVSLERAVVRGVAPARMKALESLIFNDLAFSFYNRVEEAKIALSNQGAAVIRLKDKNLDLWELYTRYQFEKDIREYWEQIYQVLADMVAASGLEPDQIDAVVKTGGSSNIPAFSQMLEDVFGPQRVKSSDVFNSVTGGLAIRARQLA